MNPMRDTITPKEWIEDSSVVLSTRYTRGLVLDHYAKANGKASPEEVIAEILAHRASVTGTSRLFMNALH